MCCYAPQRSKEMRERAHPPNTFRFCFMQQKSDITNSGMRPPCAAEHSAVNRSVVGSSPTGGAQKARKFNVYGFYFIPKLLRNLPDSAIYRVYPVMAWLDRGRIECLYFTQFIKEVFKRVFNQKTYPPNTSN